MQGVGVIDNCSGHGGQPSSLQQQITSYWKLPSAVFQRLFDWNHIERLQVTCRASCCDTRICSISYTKICTKETSCEVCVCNTKSKINSCSRVSYSVFLWFRPLLSNILLATGGTRVYAACNRRRSTNKWWIVVLVIRGHNINGVPCKTTLLEH